MKTSLQNASRIQTLGDLMVVNKGQTYEAKLAGDEGPFLLGMGIFDPSGGFRDHKVRRYSGEVTPEGRAVPGTVVVATTDMGANIKILGRSARVPEWVGDYAVVSADMGVVSWRTKDDLAQRYAYWVMRTREFREYCIRFARGTAVRRVKGTDIERFSIRDPKQAGIASTIRLLDLIDEKIESTRRVNEILDKVARTIFKSWFVDGPAAVMQGDGGALPEGWRVGKISDIATLNPEAWGKTNRPSVTRYVDLSSTKWGRVDSVALFPAANAPSRAQRVLRPGDSIVGTVRPGHGSYSLIVDEGLTGSTAFAVLRPSKKEYREFVYLAATSTDNIERLAHLSDGGAYPSVRPEIVADTEVVIPSAPALTAFSEAVGPVLDMIACNDRVANVLSEMRELALSTLVGEQSQDNHMHPLATETA